MKGAHYLLLVVMAAIWGAAWTIGKLLSVSLPPFSLGVVRYAIVVPCFFMLLFMREKTVGIEKKWLKSLFYMALFSVGIYQALFFIGVRYTGAGDAAIIITASPVITSFLSSILLKEKLTKNKMAGIALCVLGVLAISSVSGFSFQGKALGDILIFLAALFFSLYTIVLRKFSVSTESSPLRTMSWVSLFGLAMMLPFAFFENPLSYSWGPGAWMEIIYLAIFSTVLGYLLYAEGVAKLGASRTAIFMNLVPVFAAISSNLLLGEVIGFSHLAGFALIFIGVALVNRK
ncbi:MAG: DMT family transporter [Candidatus Aenigmarchaeota archaeon]|nr:DMT family transporter [Candidatus Aenigmarchaeota archaeon]